MFILIFVCVGSRNYPFNRLFVKLDELCEKGIIKEDIFAQIGTSTYIPKHFKYKDFLSRHTSYHPYRTPQKYEIDVYSLKYHPGIYHIPRLLIEQIH